MKNVIPCYYGAYGKYIARLRQIPSYIDGLIPVNRRLLLSLYEVSRDSLTKSNKIVGHALTHLHPHGDQSCYGSLQKLVLNGFASSEQSSWGGRSLHGSDSPAAMRYTLTKLSKWAKDLAFEYHNYADWENIEYEEEPIYLPSPVPMGLVGYDIITGIAFHRVTTPRYTVKDLATRLEWLLRNGPIKNYDIEKIESEKIKDVLGPEIKPNFRDCVSKPNEKDSYYRILTDGIGSLRVIPDGAIGNDGSIYIKGQVPETSFSKLKKMCDPSNKDRKYNVDIIDLCGSDDDFYSILIQLSPNKKNQDLKELFKNIWKDCLIGNINFKCYFSDEEGKTIRQGIDDILLRNYRYWVKSVLRKKGDEFNKLNFKKFEFSVISIIRDILEKNNYNIKKIDNIVYEFQKHYTNKKIKVEKFDSESSKFIINEKEITEQDIRRICKERTISRLIELELNFKEIEDQIKESKQKVKNVDRDCYDYVVNLKNKES